VVEFDDSGMNFRLHSGPRKLKLLLDLGGALLCLLMLLTFPIRPIHLSAPHLRTSEVRRSIERHTFLAQPEVDSSDRIAPCVLLSTLPVPLEIHSDKQLVENPELANIPPTRLLLRLKTGPPSANASDPLI
jgi:hypothetical protein